MIVWIAIAAVAAVVLVLLRAASRPGTFRVERAATMNAAAEDIFPCLNDFHNWKNWSPWESLDPAMQRTFGGAASGAGAIYEWSGNKKVGSGRMEIVQSSTPTHLKIKLDFLKPFEAHNTCEFTLAPVSRGTEVRWAMYGPCPFMLKLMGVFMSMDAMVGKDFERGLASLKAQIEA
jgi:hypothetical protein